MLFLIYGGSCEELEKEYYNLYYRTDGFSLWVGFGSVCHHLVYHT